MVITSCWCCGSGIKGLCVFLGRRMVRAQVFSSLCPQGWSSPSTHIYTKSLLVLGLIAPSTLEIPAASTLSLRLHWIQIVLKLPPPDDHDSVFQLLKLKFYYGVWSFIEASCTKVYPDKSYLTMTDCFFVCLFLSLTVPHQPLRIKYLHSVTVQLTVKLRHSLKNSNLCMVSSHF